MCWMVKGCSWSLGPCSELFMSLVLFGQVDKNWAVDGYRLYFALSEAWTFKTKFTQWWTKSYSSGLQPLVADMSLSPGHVAWITQFYNH